MGALARYADVRPDGSARRPTWFNLGDQDLATHFYRTARLAEGATLTDVAAEMRRAWGVDQRLLPMTDGRAADGHRAGARRGRLVPGVLRPASARRAGARRALRAATSPARRRAAARDRRRRTTIVIAPSNPIVSIGPLRALPGVDELLRPRAASTSSPSRRSSVVSR